MTKNINWGRRAFADTARYAQRTSVTGFNEVPLARRRPSRRSKLRKAQSRSTNARRTPITLAHVTLIDGVKP